MLINKIYKAIFASYHKQPGKHKIPRYIYHLTNKKNYELMLHDGVIKQTNDDLMGNGIFAIDLINFFKRWDKNKSWHKMSLQERLLAHTSKGEDDLVILKIPTQNLNHKHLKIRSQNKLFNWSFNNYDKLKKTYEIQELKNKTQVKRKNWNKTSHNLILKFLKKNESKQLTNHLTEGVPAILGRLFTQRKNAIEYIYKENIPINKVEKIGEVSMERLRISQEYDPLKPIRSIFLALLKGQPEEKSASFLKK